MRELSIVAVSLVKLLRWLLGFHQNDHLVSNNFLSQQLIERIDIATDPLPD